MEKNYNGVTIEKSWSLIEFAKEFGRPKLIEHINKETGEAFNTLAFVNQGDITYCHFGYSTQNMSDVDIVQQKDSLRVGLNSNGKYTLYKDASSEWKLINLFD